MIEFMRALKLGTVTLFGIAIPGFLILAFSLFGTVAPLVLFVLGLVHRNDVLGRIWAKDRSLTVAAVALLSYVAGYVLRLSSPDELDSISGNRVLRLMREREPAEKACWPYTGQPGDKFPYFNFAGYLKTRGLNTLAKHVTWGNDHEVPAPLDRRKRSKTAVHLMKLDVMLNCPDLFAVLESNEAHIRLMSGTWLAIRATRWAVLAGGVLSIALFIILRGNPHDPGPWLPLIGALNTALFGAMWWAMKRIENLFHYRRVNELIWIVMAADAARAKAMEARNAVSGDLS